jgi:transaldolase
MGTKDPSYSDVKYVDALIGPDTVATLPLETLNAYRDHGNPAPRLEDDLETARQVPQRLNALGINLETISAALEAEGIENSSRPSIGYVKPLRENLGVIGEAEPRVPD